MTDSKSLFLSLGHYTDTMRNALCLPAPELPLSLRALGFVIYEKGNESRVNPRILALAIGRMIEKMEKACRKRRLK